MQNTTVPLQPPPGSAPPVRGAQLLTGRGWRLPTAEGAEVRVERPSPGIGPGLYSPETLAGIGRDLPTVGKNAG